MNIQIPDHISTIKSYRPGKTILQLKEEYNWDKVAILWNNENTLGYSPQSKHAVMNAYELIHFYPDPTSEELRKVLSQRLEQDQNRIILGNGSESVLMLAIRSLCSGDDEFLTSEGGFVIIYNWAQINNVQCLTMPMTKGYGFDLNAIKSRINRNTKMIYLANCNNPTGTMLSRVKLESFIQSVPDHILIIVDEAYFEYSDALHDDFPNSIEMDYPNILTLRTFSKAYGIAGIRLGFGVGHPSIVEAMNKAKLTFEPTSLAQAAGIGALNDDDFLKSTIDNNTKGLYYLYKEFRQLKVKYVPSYGNFIMTVWKNHKEVLHIFEALMKQGVLVRPLMPPLDHCIRISVGKPEENEHCIEALSFILNN